MQHTTSEETEKLSEIITDFFNAVESACVNAKHQIAELKGVSEKNADPSKLFWEKKKGEKGEYEQTSAKANGNSDTWKNLQAKLKEHNGFLQSNGWKFWFHQQDANVIDRRKA